MTMARSASIHRLKITLRGVRPPIWRRIEVASNVTMHQLSAILEAAMGWSGGHLHAFEADGISYQLPNEFDDFSRYETIDERKARLAKVLSTVGAKLVFEYDFGDGWTHDVVVEATGPADPAVTYPRCVTGKRACPPDDCGGPWGYADLLEALADPGHPEHDDMLEWCGGPIDPDAFNPTAATASMQHAKPWDL